LADLCVVIRFFMLTSACGRF